MKKNKKKYSGTILGFFAEAGITKLDEKHLKAAEIAQDAKDEPEPDTRSRVKKWLMWAIPTVLSAIGTLAYRYIDGLF